jgi:hypothetical protein
VWRYYYATAVDVAELESTPSAEDSALVDGGQSTEKIALGSGDIPKSFMLYAAYPNPFNPETRIRYALPVESNVRLEVYNTIGQLVTVLVDSRESAGYKEAILEAASLPSGMYFYRIKAISTEGESQYLHEVRKMMVMK